MLSLRYRIVSTYLSMLTITSACCGMCVMKQKETTERALELDPYIHTRIYDTLTYMSHVMENVCHIYRYIMQV